MGMGTKVFFENPRGIFFLLFKFFMRFFCLMGAYLNRTGADFFSMRMRVGTDCGGGIFGRGDGVFFFFLK